LGHPLDFERALLVASLLLLLGVIASKASSRLGIPALLLFLGIGMLAGSEGPGGIPFDDPVRTQFLGVVALAFILFAGGLETSRGALKQVLWQGLSLATVGVLITAVLVAAFARLMFGVSWLEGLLLGSIVSSTDAAAVFSVLRSQRIGLKGNTTALLEFESGSNDPMAVFLTTSVLGLLGSGGASWTGLIPTFVLQIAGGTVAGLAVGKGTTLLLNRLKLEAEGLYLVVTVAAVLFAFGGASLLHGSGYLAVYIAGIVMGNDDLIH
jgi:cell volume regulation protein A